MPKFATSFRLSEEAMRLLRQEAHAHQVSMQAILELAIRAYCTGGNHATPTEISQRSGPPRRDSEA